MATYSFKGGNLNDPGQYTPNGPPTAADDIDATGSATSGSISVNALKNYFHLASGTITATKADGVDVGNINNVGGSATMTVTGTVDFAAVYKNGTLTAETIGNVLQGRGGTINLTKDYNVGAGVAGTNGTIDVGIEGGKLDVNGAMNLVGAQTEVSITDSATLNITTLTFGSGKTGISAGNKSTINISGASSINVGAGDGFGAGDESVINAAGLDITVEGSSTTARASIGVGTKSKVTVNNVDIKTFGALNVGGFGVAEAEFNAKVIKNIGTIAIDGSTLNAKSIAFGDADGTADFYGKWTYTGNSGLFPIRSGGFVSIEETLELKNQDDRGILLDPTVSSGFGGSMHVGGTTKVGNGELLVDGSGKIVGHGMIETTKTTVDGGGYIEASKGTIVLDGDVTGSGTLKIGDTSVIHIIDKADIDVVFMDRKDTSLAHDSVLKLDRPGDFLGTVSGLAKGTTIEVSRTHLPEWTGLKNPQIAHTEINGGKLEILFTDIFNTALPPSTVTIDIAGDMTGKVFSTRDILPDQNVIDFSLQDASKQIKTGVSGKLSASELGVASDYVDTLVSGWAAWDPTAGPIKYFFATTGNVQEAISLHGEILPIRPGDEKGGVLDTWSTTEMNAFKDIVKIYESVSGLKFQETKVLSEANMVWWQTIPLSRTLNKLGYSDNLALHPEGVVWQVFGVNPSTGFQYLDMGGLGRNTAIHEIGHTLGLAHPFDGGPQPDRQTFPGVPQNDSSNQGFFNQNQSVYTVMSYNEGLNLNTKGKEKFGDQGGLGAFDIAAIQALYGKNTEYNKTDTIYDLKTTNGIGTGWSAIWDAGGTDTIINNSKSVGAIIDLRAATLVSGPNAGGYISRATNIEGGYTIAYGVVIENATGGSVSDTLFGNDADNILDGRGGADVMGGGLGNDTYYVDTTSDSIVEFKDQGIDTVITTQSTFKLPDHVEILKVLGAVNSNITGNADPNTLTGGNGNDTLDGGGGGDILTGGLGNDTYIIDDPGDQVIELDGQGNDTVISSLVIGLPNFVENFTYTGTADISLVGTAGTNTLTGGGGNDTLDGGTDSGLSIVDKLIGGAGNDIYIVRDLKDAITEAAGPAGGTADEVKVQATVGVYTLAANVENLTVLGTATAPLTSTSTSGRGIGNALNNIMMGANGSQVLQGGIGNDIHDGGGDDGFEDRLEGGAGNDIYIVYALDTVVEAANAGIDTVRTALAAYTLGVNVDNLTYTGSGVFAGTGNILANVIIGGTDADTLSGDAGNDRLDGGISGADTLTGGTGNDTYVVRHGAVTIVEDIPATNGAADAIESHLASFDLSSNVMYAAIENLTLAEGSPALSGKGNALANIITGNSADNTLDGGTDSGLSIVDKLIGGAGNDIYIVRDLKDAITEAAGPAGGTADEVKVQATVGVYTLAANVENLTVLGSATAPLSSTSTSGRGIGNALDNIMMGANGSQVLQGGVGNDTHDGGGNDGFEDRLEGGAGNDIYIVYALDTVVEAANAGIDTVKTALAAYTLGVNVDNLTYTGSAAFAGTGNILANVIIGGTDADTLSGDAGNDRLDGGISGADTLTGGTGNDTYVVRHGAVTIVEDIPPTNGAADAIESHLASFDLSNVMYAGIENLTLAEGSAAVSGTGNALANIITGNSGNNVLSGGAGDGKVDTLIGGLGDDTYILETGDKVTEAVGGGKDTIQVGFTYTLAANLEDLVLTGAATANGTGNTDNNKITGNSNANVLNGMTGDDTLDGGGGLDTLIGGLGNDTLTGGSEGDVFFFNAALSATNVDTIADFQTGVDKIRLENAIFTKVGAAGALNANFFVSGAGAVPLDANDYLIYDTTTGILAYDSNGNAPGGPTPFAVLIGAVTLAASDFDIV